MHIDIIDDLETFERLRGNWDAVYAADPEAQLFVSWPWFQIWLTRFKLEWFVLAAKPSPESKDYVAFFPLQLRSEVRKGHGFVNEIKMAGAEFSDYRGFLCEPAHAADAIAAFGAYVKTRNWANLYFDNIRASDERFRQFMKAFPLAKFSAESIGRPNPIDKVDNSICPMAKLPGDWETYLNTNLSANTRQKAKRFLKKMDETDEFRITYATADTVERDIDTLLRFWETKWRSRKKEKTETIIHNNRVMLNGCFKHDALFLPVFWKGDTPLAALGTLIDRQKKSLHFLITGRDETFNSPPPGFILHAHSIRWAIQNGFTVYDFLQGNEPYKYMFGVEEVHLKNFCIRTKSKRNLGDRLDPVSLATVLQKASDLHKSGDMAEAERGYRQILEVEPNHVGALYLLAQLKATKGDHAAAKELFESYLRLKPEIHGAWFRLGKTLQALGENENALKCYRKVLDLDPANPEVPNLLVALSPLNDVLKTMRDAVPKALQGGAPAPAPLALKADAARRRRRRTGAP